MRQAIDFLVPYARGDRPWTYPELTAFTPGAIHALLRRAAIAWNEPAYRELALKIGGGNDRLNLIVQ